ncbi:hypothetical protein EC960109_1439B, partial [Escherichia coli 96.0109]
NTKKRFKYIPE